MDVPDCVCGWVCTELIVLVLVGSVNEWWSTLTVIFDLVWMGLQMVCGMVVVDALSVVAVVWLRNKY